MDAGPSTCSEGDNGGGGLLPDKIPLLGLGGKEPHSDEEVECDSEDLSESVCEDGAPPLYQTVAEFCFYDQTDSTVRWPPAFSCH